MKISDIDKNFAIETNLDLPGIVWLDAKDAPFTIHGLYRSEKGKPFIRMPEEIAQKISGGVAALNFNTAGGRIRFRTDSPYVAISCKKPDSGYMHHMTKQGQSGFDLYRSDAGNYTFVGPLIPGGTGDYSFVKDTDGKLHTYTLDMPLYDGVNEVYIGLKKGSELDCAEPYQYRKPILYYGSSITQGGCASRPGNAYQAMISRRFDADYINLGFSGNAKGEPAMIEYLASIDSSVFVCDYDHNAPSAAHLRKTHYPLYAAYRAAHPDTPIILASRGDYHPDIPDIVERREIVMETYDRALADGDKNVRFVDGMHLFDGDFADSCTVDTCHPNDLGFFRMAQKFGDVIEEILK